MLALESNFLPFRPCRKRRSRRAHTVSPLSNPFPAEAHCTGDSGVNAKILYSLHEKKNTGLYSPLTDRRSMETARVRLSLAAEAYMFSNRSVK